MVDAIECQPQALDGREHGNRRGDHAVAVEQRRTTQAAHHQKGTQTRVGTCRAPGQGGQRHDAAFALVVGAQHKHHVLDGNDPDQRPENQREDA
ncbi:hypothetical protein D9M71_514200 [compost metagenome]